MLLNGAPAKVLSLLKFLHHIFLQMHYFTVQIPSRDCASYCMPDHMDEMDLHVAARKFSILIAESLSFW